MTTIREVRYFREVVGHISRWAVEKGELDIACLRMSSIALEFQCTQATYAIS